MKEQQHQALTLALPLQSLPIPCYPRPSGASTALLPRDSRSAPPDTTPGRGDCAGLLPRWKGMGKKSTPLHSSASFGEVRSGEGLFRLPSVSAEKEEAAHV